MVHHKLRVTTWVFSLLVDVNVYIEPIRRGCSLFCKNVDDSNMSTKVLSKTYIRSYIHAQYQEGLVELLQQASFDSWLDYPTILKEVRPGFPVQPQTMCAGFLSHQTMCTGFRDTKRAPGMPSHGVSTATYPTPRVSATHGRQHISYKHQKLVATPRQRARAVNKSRGSIGFGPNAW